MRFPIFISLIFHCLHKHNEKLRNQSIVAIATMIVMAKAPV